MKLMMGRRRLVDLSYFWWAHFHHTSKHPEWRQHIFEFDFKVDKLGVLMSKATTEGIDKPLGNLYLEGFSLYFELAKYDMKVDINLR